MIIICILRIPDLYCLPEKRCIATTEQILYRISPTLINLLLGVLFIIYTWCTIAIQVERHSDNLFASAGLPTIVQALWFNTACLKIINAVRISSGIIVNDKAIEKCLVVHILIPYFF